jgi:hypothetical protein
MIRTSALAGPPHSDNGPTPAGRDREAAALGEALAAAIAGCGTAACLSAELCRSVEYAFDLAAVDVQFTVDGAGCGPLRTGRGRSAPALTRSTVPAVLRVPAVVQAGTKIQARAHPPECGARRG